MSMGKESRDKLKETLNLYILLHALLGLYKLENWPVVFIFY